MSTSPKTYTDASRKETMSLSSQLLLAGALVLLVVGSAVAASTTTNNEAELPAQNTPTANSSNQEVNVNSAAFAEISLSATAAYVLDLTSGEVLYEKNADTQLPLASVTKLMTALVAHELLDETTLVTIDETALRQDGLSGFSESERFQRLDLSNMMLVSSSNDGAYALAAAAGTTLDTTSPAEAFVTAMNVKAAELGMSNSYFLNPSGLDSSTTEAGSFGSAKDVATLLSYLITTYPTVVEPTTLPAITISSAAGYRHEATNTNYYVDEIPSLLASKTGYTAIAGGNLVIAFDAGFNQPVVVAVLGADRQSRFTDVLALTDATISALTTTE